MSVLSIQARQIPLAWSFLTTEALRPLWLFHAASWSGAAPEARCAGLCRPGAIESRRQLPNGCSGIIYHGRAEADAVYQPGIGLGPDDVLQATYALKRGIGREEEMSLVGHRCSTTTAGGHRRPADQQTFCFVALGRSCKRRSFLLFFCPRWRQHHVDLWSCLDRYAVWKPRPDVAARLVSRRPRRTGRLGLRASQELLHHLVDAQVDAEAQQFGGEAAGTGTATRLTRCQHR